MAALMAAITRPHAMRADGDKRKERPMANRSVLRSLVTSRWTPGHQQLLGPLCGALLAASACAPAAPSPSTAAQPPTTAPAAKPTTAAAQPATTAPKPAAAVPDSAD